MSKRDVESKVGVSSGVSDKVARMEMDSGILAMGADELSVLVEEAET